VQVNKFKSSFLLLVLLLTLPVWQSAYGNLPDVAYRSPELAKVIDENGFVSVYDENNRLVKEKTPSFSGLKASHSWLGEKVLLPILKSSWAAKLFAFFNGSSLSSYGIEDFCREYNIDLTDFVPSSAKDCDSFNHFFTRSLSPKGQTKRRPSPNPAMLASPADGKIFVLENIKNRDHFWVKESDFDLNSFLGNSKLAAEFNDGLMAIFRLSPDNYHRVHMPFDGKIIEQYKLGTDLESVNPYSSLKNRQPLIKNKRHIVVAEHQNLGKFIVVFVGAMMVGNIQIHAKADLKKGEELGLFEFGGSTVVLLFRAGTVELLPRFVKNSATGYETRILTGNTFAKLAS